MLRHLLNSLFLGLFDQEVQIGIPTSNHACGTHGVIHARTQYGDVKHVEFIADKPRYLKHPTPDVVAGLFKQAQRLGLMPEHIELWVGDIRRVFILDQDEPIFVQRMA